VYSIIYEFGFGSFKETILLAGMRVAHPRLVHVSGGSVVR